MILLKKLTSPVIELLLLIDIISAIIFNLWGALKIDWRLSYEVYHVLTIISVVFLLAGLFTSISFIFFRHNDTINSSNNLFCIYMSQFMTLLNILGLIFISISFYQVRKDFKYFDEMVSKKFKKDVEVLSSNGQWFILTVSMWITIGTLLLQIPIWRSIHFRLKSKINGSIPDQLDNYEVQISSLLK